MIRIWRRSLGRQDSHHKGKWVPDILELLGKSKENSALSDEWREKAEITTDRLKLLVDGGVLERSEEKVLVRTVPMKKRIATYG